MINPNQTHSARAVVESIGHGREYTVRLKWNGARVGGFDLPARFTEGSTVCIQASWSICLDRYVIRSIRFAPGHGGGR